MWYNFFKGWKVFMKLEIVRGSVVYADVDVIVNAANQYLQEGGGVCGAIFQGAGSKKLQQECDAIGYCKVGHAVMTNGYNLKAKHIIHAVGPQDLDGDKLKSAFLNCLIIADNNNLKTIGLVPISTGIFGFPKDKCAQIAVKTILDFNASSLQTCYMYCYSDNEYQIFAKELAKYEK